MIDIRGMHFCYGEGGFSLHVPRLIIPAGEKIAFTGPSGSGKSTLVYLIAGILTPRAGTVRIDQTSISTQSDKELRDFRIRGIGFIFQEFELLDYLVVRENILLPYFLNPSLKLTSDVRDRADRLATSMNLSGQLDRRPRSLSQGERQRVAICRAMITQPKLLIADEPTGNLDPPTARLSMGLLLQQVEGLGTTLIVVTHNHGLLQSFDRVVDMGELTREGHQ